MNRAMRRSIALAALVGTASLAGVADAQQPSPQAKTQAQRQAQPSPSKADAAKRKAAAKKAAPAPAGKLDAAQAQSEVEAGINALAQGRHDAAVTSLSNALSAGSLPQAQTARALYYRGVAQRRQSKPAQAISDLTSALWIKNGLSEDQRADALQQRSGAYREAGLPDQSEPPGGRQSASKSGGSQAKSGGPAVFSAVAPAAPSSSGGGGLFASLFGGGTNSTTPPPSPAPVAAAAPPPAVAPTPLRTTAPAAASPPATPAVPARPQSPTPQSSAPTSADKPATRLVPVMGGGSSLPTGFQDMPEPVRHVEVSTRAPVRAATAPAAPAAPAETVAKPWTEITRVSTPAPTPAAKRTPPATSAGGPPSTVAAAPARQKVEAAPGPGGSVQIVVAAVRNADEAQGIATRLQAKFARELGGRAPVVDQTTVGGLGSIYRVQVGPFASSQATQALCSRLKSDGMECRIVAQ